MRRHRKNSQDSGQLQNQTSLTLSFVLLLIRVVDVPSGKRYMRFANDPTGEETKND